MTTAKKIMIIDDDEDDTDFFCEAVTDIDESHTCVTARNGEDALLKLRQETISLPDLIFLDLNMPRMDGNTCLRELKKDAVLKDIPVIIYTTSAHLKEKNEILRLGAVHFLTKAATIDGIQKGIRKALLAISTVGKSNEVIG